MPENSECLNIFLQLNQVSFRFQSLLVNVLLNERVNIFKENMSTNWEFQHCINGNSFHQHWEKYRLFTIGKPPNIGLCYRRKKGPEQPQH